MHGPPNAKQQYIAIGLIVVLHMAVVPLVLHLQLGLQWEAFFVQSTLLSIYFGFGTGSRFLRGILTLLGIAASIVIEQCIWAAINQATYSMSMIHLVAAGAAQWVFAPAAILCVLFTALRPLLGSIRSCPDPLSTRFGIADWFVVTMLAAVTMTLFTVGMSNAPDLFDYQMLAINTGPTAVCAIGSLLLALSRRWWWIGATLLAADFLLEWVIFVKMLGHTLQLEDTLIPWLLILATLVSFRLMGYKLVRPAKVADAAM